MELLILIFALLLSIDFVRTIWTNSEKVFAAYRNFSLPILLVSLPILAATYTVLVDLLTFSPTIMGFSWWRMLFSSSSGTGGTNINSGSGNIMLGAAYIPYYGIAFCLLLLMVLPVLAEAEEKAFRQGTKSWRDGTARSVVFGLAHMVVGIPLGAAIALIIPGLFYTALYFRGGVKLSTQAHFQWNFLVVLLILRYAIDFTLAS